MSQTQQRVQTAAQLFDQVRTYLRIERRYLTLDLSDRIARVLSWFVVALIVIGAAMLAVTLLLLTLIHLLSDLLGNVTLAYAIATGVSLLLVWVVWSCRQTLFMRPIARAIRAAMQTDEAPLPADPDEPSLPPLPDDKQQLRLMARIKEHEIRDQFDRLVQPDNDDPSPGQRVGNIIDRGLTIYHGASIAFGLFNLFKGKKGDTPKAK